MLLMNGSDKYIFGEDFHERLPLAICPAALASIPLALPRWTLARLTALAPGGHPAGLGLAALLALLDILHLPHDKVLSA